MNESNSITKENAISFLLQCYFGHIEDPILSAIDRAYLDMQAHTVSGEQKDLYSGRKIATEELYKAIDSIDDSLPFDEWHKTTALAMKRCYSKLSYGQIQKWINMSIKYLYTFKLLGVDGISEYFNSENSVHFHPALDSYVLNAIGVDTKWSMIAEYKTYYEIQKKLTFAGEYIEWPRYAYEAGRKKNGESKLPEKGTYKRYVWDTGGYSFNPQNQT